MSGHRFNIYTNDDNGTYLKKYKNDECLSKVHHYLDETIVNKCSNQQYSDSINATDKCKCKGDKGDEGPPGRDGSYGPPGMQGHGKVRPVRPSQPSIRVHGAPHKCKVTGRCGRWALRSRLYVYMEPPTNARSRGGAAG